ncbi:MAG TPA: tRNA (N(6)-L-threonylcarbamoyladenosine(37)-C(2))-methylthiotransferase MtaB [Lachnospiraceae bacterium]|nr:tRNA (N(6)-L-threonylcarbamoyladenosine(37)-C(2))-methylthiotransferase MtaB [Lachnospiraceae bacterium]
MNKTVAFLTLGCKVNLYDTEAMTELFSKRGYEIRDFEQKADIYVINTCTVTNFGDKKSRQMIRRARRKNPLAIIIATGCYAQVADSEVAAIDGINIVLGTANRLNIVDIAENYSPDEPVLNLVSDIKKEKIFEPMSVESMKDRTRAYMKIQDGCNRYCSYCIIPYARGPIRSRPLEDVVAEAKRLADNGFKEIVLTGIHIASYGAETGNFSFIDAIEAVNNVEGIERIRFSSMEPKAITDEFIERVGRCEKVCDHYHLSLQSGCDKTLKEMNRRYSCEEYYEAVCKLRKAFPDVAVTTDVIAGFPGESDEDFAQTLDFLRKVHIDKIHAFPYSPKKGTPAAVRKDQVAPEVKAKRTEQLLRLSDILNEEFLLRFKGKEKAVLFENKSDGYWCGHTTNYIKVMVKTDENINNLLKNTVLTSVYEPEIMLGELKNG